MPVLSCIFLELPWLDGTVEAGAHCQPAMACYEGWCFSLQRVLVKPSPGLKYNMRVQAFANQWGSSTYLIRPSRKREMRTFGPDPSLPPLGSTEAEIHVIVTASRTGMSVVDV